VSAQGGAVALDRPPMNQSLACDNKGIVPRMGDFSRVSLGVTLLQQNESMIT